MYTTLLSHSNKILDDVLSLAIKTQIKTYLCRLSVSLRRLGCIGAVPEENVDTDHVNYCCYYDFQFMVDLDHEYSPLLGSGLIVGTVVCREKK